MAFQRSTSSRELSTRVEIDFHRRRNRFRRATWVTALLLGLGVIVWLSAEMVRGERRIYLADRVSTPHKMFENDCSKCHADAEWQPLRRLLSFDDSVRSVENEKCLACHDGPIHHTGQVPSHSELSCATCHREHEGDEQLAWVADRHCLQCHADLKTKSGEGPPEPSEAYARRILSFDARSGDGGHPEFAIARLVQLDSRDALDTLPDDERTRLERIIYDDQPRINYFAREGDRHPEPRWQDNARLRFNHAVHLTKGLFIGRDAQGRTIVDDYSKNCMACHEFDAARRYMQPINFEQHCASCHPLYVGVGRHACDEVPHERPELVAGFLSELYARDALLPPDETQPESRPTGLRPRPLPGRLERIASESGSAERVDGDASASVERAIEALIGQEGGFGGCRYCHQIQRNNLPGKFPWQIVPPEIPSRWLVHSEFRHDSHRMLSCTECHRSLENGASVLESVSTGDVLIPSIETCRRCHTSSRQTGTADREWARFTGARTDCVECHRYHDHALENFYGPLTIDLVPSEGTRSENPGSSD